MFDFLNAEKIEPLVPEVVHHGPNGADLKKMTRRQVMQDFLDVYQEEAGKELIRMHMKHDPKGFFDVVKRMIPTNLGVDAGELLKVSIIDKFGNQMEIEANGGPDQIVPPHRDLTSPRSTGQGEALPPPGQPSVTVTDRFETATSGNQEMDFTL